MATKDQYRAGLWRGEFVKQLGWSVNNPFPRYGKLETYRAPSWSWASIDDPVLVPAIRWGDRYFVSISDVVVETADGGEFGQPCGGVLTLSCDVLLPGWTSLPDPLKPGHPAPAMRFHCNHTSFMILMKWDYKRDLSEAVGLHYLLYLQDWVSDDTGLTGHGIVLQPTQRARGEYRRVGYFLTGDEDGAKILRTIDSRGEGLEESDFVGSAIGMAGTEEYIIDII